jgi:hypothetical protein
VGVSSVEGLIEPDRPYPSHLFGGQAVHRLHGQNAVGLAQLFPELTDTSMRLLLGCTEDPINPVFKVARPAC